MWTESSHTYLEKKTEQQYMLSKSETSCNTSLRRGASGDTKEGKCTHNQSKLLIDRLKILAFNAGSSAISPAAQ